MSEYRTARSGRTIDVGARIHGWDTRLCGAPTKNGGTCRRKVYGVETLCGLHDPAAAEYRRKLFHERRLKKAKPGAVVIHLSEMDEVTDRKGTR